MNGEPWTQARELQLQRLHAGLASVDQALFDGEIDRHIHQRASGDIRSLMGPLAQQREQFQQQMKHQAAHEAAEQAAQEQAIEHANATHRAQRIMDRVGVVVDPLTGNRAHLVQDGKGAWQEVEFSASRAGKEADDARRESLRGSAGTGLDRDGGGDTAPSSGE